MARNRNFSTGSSANDGNGHGSHVSGTIAACNNSIGGIDVAPCAPVVAVRVLNNAGSGTTSGVIAGVDYVAANGSPGDVANMSLGGGVSRRSTRRSSTRRRAASNSRLRRAMSPTMRTTIRPPGPMAPTSSRFRRSRRAIHSRRSRISATPRSITPIRASASSRPIRMADTRRSPARRWRHRTLRVSYCSAIAAAAEPSRAIRTETPTRFASANASANFQRGSTRRAAGKPAADFFWLKHGNAPLHLFSNLALPRAPNWRASMPSRSERRLEK